MAKKATAPKPEQTEGAELALFPKLNLPAVTQITEKMNATFKTMFTRIEEDIRDLPTDMTDPKNRAAVASYAYKVSRTKTGLDEAAAQVAAGAKRLVDSVNVERRTLKETLDQLRDKARAPLDAWEKAEEERERRVQIAKGYLETVHVYQTLEEVTSEIIRADFMALNAQEFTAEKYGEDAGMLAELKTLALDRLDRTYKAHLKAEQEAAELEQLRREKAEREEADRIRREQEEEEKAARMAEEKRLIDAENERIRQDEERDRIQKEAKELADQEAKDRVEKAEREAEALRRSIEEQQEASRRFQIQQEEQAKQREEDAKRREEEVRQAERDRLNREEQARIKADQERAADLAHRKKINAAAVAGLIKSCQLSEQEAQAIIIAIYKEQVPHVSINY